MAVKAISAGTMTSNDHIAAVKHTDGPEGINKNGHGEVFDADRQARASATMMAHLSGDPRKSVMFQRRSDGSQAVADLIGMPNGRTSSDTRISTVMQSLEFQIHQYMRNLLMH